MLEGDGLDNGINMMEVEQRFLGRGGGERMGGVILEGWNFLKKNKAELENLHRFARVSHLHTFSFRNRTL